MRKYLLLVFLSLGGLSCPAQPAADNVYKRMLVDELAKEIKRLSKDFEHFKNFSPNSEMHVVAYTINYKNNVQYVPNPRYEELLKQQRKPDNIKPHRLRHAIRKTIATYPKKTAYISIFNFFRLPDKSKASGCYSLL